MSSPGRALWNFGRALLVAAPATALALYLLLSTDAAAMSWTLLGLALLSSALLAGLSRQALARRLGTISGVLTSYREGDFSIRARLGSEDSSLAAVLAELNQLGDTLRGHRLGEMEAWALLRKVMSELDVVVLAFDEEGHVRLANEAAARLVGRAAPTILGETAATLGLSELLSGPAPRTISGWLPLGARQWELRRGSFRLSGAHHTLVVLSDVSSALRENEREAWRRLIRVMGHEINNSLAPIRAVSDSLLSRLGQTAQGPGWNEELLEGLSLIARRSEALGRFMTSYATLARLPPPKLGPVELAPLIKKVAILERRRQIEVLGGPELLVRADADQLEQVLINLLKNAVDAVEGTSGGVRVRWSEERGTVEIAIEDDGPGVSDTANLFVPFFTTKPQGSGIGLVLSQQIVEAHQGQLSLATRPEGRGAVARVRLPSTPPAARAIDPEARPAADPR